MDQQKLNFSEQENKQLEEELLKNKLTPDMMRLAFYALMNSAMAYREMFFRDDIALFKSAKAPDVMVSRTQGNAKMTQKTLNKMHEKALDLKEKRILFFNKKVYEELEAVTKGMTEAGKANFENITGYFVSCAEEMLAARDQHEVLALLKMYNHGDLDLLFENSRKEKQAKFIKENENDIPSPPVAATQDNS